MNKKVRTTRSQRASKAAAKPNKVVIRKLPTGVPGLDEIMGGGLPEFSFNIIAGGPGCGKTTFAHQFIFANATQKRPALYFTILGESAIKMLRYQQQYTFFDPSKLNGAIRFINLSQVVLEKDSSAVLEAIIKEVEAVNPGIVVVDSFRIALRKKTDVSEMDVQFFVQQLALHLTSWEATSFLIGEYVEAEIQENPVFTVADGLLWLSQVTERNSVVRKLQVLKLRGQATVPGLHTFRIAEDGLQTFSRTLGLAERQGRPDKRPRLSIGIPGAKRLVIDSLVGFEMALAPGFRTDFRESLYRMMASLTGTGVTVLNTVELDESFTEFR
jgi:circadian clock protein KaiC